MTILDRYIARVVVASIATVLGVLVAIFSFFEFIDEVDQLGRGHYGLFAIGEFVFLSVPRLTYDLFPVAALMGSLLGLGQLVTHNELTVMRAAGIPLARSAFAIMKGGAVVMLAALVLGEFIAPLSEELAQRRKSVATTAQIALKTRNGFWIRDRQSFVNIRKVLPGDRVERIYIYEFDDHNRLKVSTIAQAGYYHKGRWVLEGIEQTVFEPDRVRTRRSRRATWESLLHPDLINLVIINPQHLSIRDLYQYIEFLDRNAQNSQRYRHALWLKISYPLATGVMVFLAIPIVLTSTRRGGIGQRVFIGSCIGLGFHIVNKAAGSFGAVFNLNPALSALIPTALTLCVALALMRRVS